MIDGETKVHSLYGFPISHSLSPLIFNTTFQKLGLNRTYVPFAVQPRQLGNAVEAARSLGFAGFNVTMPHKTAIIEFLDTLDKEARSVGSVNTVANTPRGLVGYNTDGEGAVRALKAHGIDPSKRRILILGAGGVARSLVHRLSKVGEEVKILNRTLEKAEQLADSVSGSARVSHAQLNRSNLGASLKNSDLFVNSTPVQTATLLRDHNISPNHLNPRLWVFDLAYDKPLEPLPQVRRVSPLEMLVQQAALSYEIWIGEPAPLDLMRSVLVEHNGGDWK